MYLADCHNHTRCSPDSEAALLDMARAAADAGLSELCTTDHIDLLGWHGEPLGDWDWQPVLDQYRDACRACPTGLELRLGIELGGIPFFRERGLAITRGVPLDLVIGSVHNVEPSLGGEDFFCLEYRTEQSCYDALDNYFTSLLALAELDGYDVVGHIIYPLRYMNTRAGHHVTLDRYADRIEQLLRRLAERGRGIEVNTNRGAEVEAWRDVLRTYRRLGGEIVTLGTDAHRPEDVGKGIAQAAELLRQEGFRHYAVYRRRRPEFIPLV